MYAFLLICDTVDAVRLAEGLRPQQESAGSSEHICSFLRCLRKGIFEE